MQIKRIEPIAVSLPMKKPVFMAGVEIRQADNVLVRVEADNGVIGWGRGRLRAHHDRRDGRKHDGGGALSHARG
jgi:L-alanine-DL-glutamate epimerase-like enolase superfamily enzyme